jgi:hypothetical protein
MIMSEFTSVFFDGTGPALRIPSAKFASLTETRETAFSMADGRQMSSIIIESDQAKLVEHWFREDDRWRQITHTSLNEPWAR